MKRKWVNVSLVAVHASKNVPLVFPFDRQLSLVEG